MIVAKARRSEGARARPCCSPPPRCCSAALTEGVRGICAAAAVRLLPPAMPAACSRCMRLPGAAPRSSGLALDIAPALASASAAAAAAAATTSGALLRRRARCRAARRRRTRRSAAAARTTMAPPAAAAAGTIDEPPSAASAAAPATAPPLLADAAAATLTAAAAAVNDGDGVPTVDGELDGVSADVADGSDGCTDAVPEGVWPLDIVLSAVDDELAVIDSDDGGSVPVAVDSAVEDIETEAADVGVQLAVAFALRLVDAVADRLADTVRDAVSDEDTPAVSEAVLAAVPVPVVDGVCVPVCVPEPVKVAVVLGVAVFVGDGQLADICA